MIPIEDVDDNKPFVDCNFFLGHCTLITEISLNFHYLCSLLFPSAWVHWDALNKNKEMKMIHIKARDFQSLPT